jgi:hypothetical protein
MKIIKDITVKVTYTVGLGGIEVSDKMYEILKGLEGKEVETGMVISKEEEEAMEWLSDNFKERDAFDWSYEIEEIE